MQTLHLLISVKAIRIELNPLGSEVTFIFLISLCQSSRSNARGRVTLPIKAMFQHQAQSSQLLGIGEPGSILHPGWVGWALSSYHKEHRTTRFVEGFINKVPLRGKTERVTLAMQSSEGAKEVNFSTHLYRQTQSY